MKFDLGEKLKSLRKKRDLTQEQLAEYLGVSFQAISKWETNAAMPDISMFPILANFYGVTTDELLGVDTSKINEKINAYLKEADNLYKAWKLKEMVEVARKACVEFPGNDNIFYYLAWSLGQAQNVIRTKSENLNEAIKIAERILCDSTDTDMRLKTTSLLAYLYHWNGNDEKSYEYANQLPRLAQTSGYLIGRLGLKKGKEKTQYAKSLIYQYYEAMIENIKVLCDFNFSESESVLSPEKRIELLKQMIQIQEIVFGRELLFQNFTAMQCCYTIAALYLIVDKFDEALRYLEKALDYADKYESYDEKALYLSEMQFGEETNERCLWSQSAYKDMLCEFNDKRLSMKYEKLNNDLRYQALVEKVQKKAEQPKD